MRSPTFRQLWLSVEHHAGDTNYCTQAEVLVLAAEKQTGFRPHRRTELLQERIAAYPKERQPTEKRSESQKAALEKAQFAKKETLTELEQARLFFTRVFNINIAQGILNPCKVFMIQRNSG